MKNVQYSTMSDVLQKSTDRYRYIIYWLSTHLRSMRNYGGSSSCLHGNDHKIVLRIPRNIQDLRETLLTFLDLPLKSIDLARHS